MKSYNEILSDVTKTATKIPQSDYLDTGKYRIFDQGKEYSVGFSNDEQDVVSDYPYIIFGDHTRVVKYVNEPCFIGADGVKLLKVINKDFNPRFVYYNILAKPIENQGYARHFKFLKEIQFTEKTLSVQTNIVTELDTIQSAIDNKKQQLSLLDEAVKSEFVEMFGENPVESGKWKVEKWANTVKITNGKDYKKLIVKKGIYPVYGSGGDMGIHVDEYLCSENTVIIGRKGNIDKPIFVKEKFWNVDTAFGLNIDETGINPYYFFEHCKTYDFRSMDTGVTIPSLTKNALFELNIAVPPLTLQNQFAAFVQQIDKSKFVVKQQIADLQELLDSKMQEYFS